MLNYIVIPVFAVLMLAGVQQSFAATAEEPVIGTILKVQGKVTLRPAGRKDSFPAKAKTEVRMHDVIETAGKARALILFIDNTQMTLSDNTKLTVDEYVFNPDKSAENKGEFNILAGSFQYLSGLIARKKDPDVTIKTSYGSIGIRGTTFWGGKTGGGYGFYVKDGKIVVVNGGGSAKVNENEGTIVPSAGAPPGPPGPWSQEQVDKMNDSISFKEAEDKPDEDDLDTRMKDLPMDETGEPDLVPYSPDGGGRFGGGN